MTSRERYNAWLLRQSGVIDSRFEVWQAAEHDMLERVVELIQSQPNGSYRAELITAGMIRKLKELLNEQH